MATHDYNIANQGFPGFRADLNDALAAIVSNNSNATAPATTFAHMLWVDTAANPSVLKIRNADNDAWVTIGSINQTDDKFKLTPADGVSTDTISELTSAAGVTIDGVLLKDSGVVTGAGTVSAPVYSTTGDLNTGIFFPAADTIAFAEGGAESLRLTNNRSVLVGGTIDTAETSGFVTIQRTDAPPGLDIFRNDTSISDTDVLAQIRFLGNDTTSNTPVQLAYIRATASGTHGAGDNPTDLVFATTPDGSASVAEVARLTESKYLRFASGTGGIQFGGDTAAANALDDYEEGTWTPAITNFTTNSGTFAGVGTYTKIGNMVTVRMRQTSGDISWTSGSSYITGLPFAPDSTSGGAGSYTNGGPTIQGSVLSYVAGGAGQLWMASNQSSQTSLIITATYFV